MARQFRVVATTKLGARKLVLRKRGGGFTFTRRKAAGSRMSAYEAKRARKWARRRGNRNVRIKSGGQFTHVELASGARWPSKDLCKRLDRVGARLSRRIRIVSGDRSPYEAWRLRDGYLRRKPGYNLAARCCTRYSGSHSWASCGKNPLSNHARGRAADCGVITRLGRYVSIGRVQKARKAMRDVGLCLPVGAGEVWHVEIGSTWRS